jgi:hypothetical protein
MPWMLQPHNWTQAIRPNLYNVDYRRVGAYKGMGGFMGRGLGQTDCAWPDCPDVMTAGQIAALPGTVGPSATSGQTVGQFLQNFATAGQIQGTLPTGQQAAAGVTGAQVTNLLPWIAGGGLLLLLLLGRGRR